MIQTVSFLLPLWLNGSMSFLTPGPHVVLQQRSADQFLDSTLTAGGNSVVPQIKAGRISGNTPNIDGILDEEIWETGQVVNEFWQREPKEGSPATERTEVRIFYDEEALYVGARMYSDHPEKIGAAATRRDQLGYAETFIINLDCYHDRKTSYTYGVTVAGVKQDYYHPIDDEIKSKDVSFNPVWGAKVTVDSIGWSAELKIPFSQLRFTDEPVQIWGVNLNRYIPSRNEDTYWRLRRNRDTGWSSLFGDLVGIEGIRPTDRIEVLPYMAGGATITGARDPNNPFDDGRNLTSRVGTDVKMGFGPNLTLDGTVNPDFGQVEADPAVVNLTAFEIVFTERRPFFVEGNKLLSNTGQTFFYSRRIGAPPHGNATGSYIDRPNNSTILGAAKVSGRLGSGLSLGALGAITRREYAQALDISTGINSVEVEPLTEFGVVRLEQEFGPYVSTAGVILTGVRRQFSEGSSLSTLLARQAYSGGGNWTLRFEGGMYELTGDAGFSYVEGNPEAIRRVQTSSAHYFQRPDATYATFDPTRESLTGYGSGFGFNKLGGEHWLWGTNLAVRSPGFELNDFGQLSSADDIELTSNLRYRQTLPTEIFHNYDFGITAKGAWNFEKIRQLMLLTFSGRVTWKNFWRTTLELSYKGRAVSDNLTRGGPLMGTIESWNVATSAASGVTSKSKFSVGASYGANELGGWTYGINGSFAPRPADDWEFSLTPSYVRAVEVPQYVISIAGGGQATFGRRYVFSFIDRSTLSVQFRFNYNFTPDLSLETYAEPFAASGRYFDFGELAAAQNRDLRMYGSDGTTVSRNADGSLTITDGPATFSISNRDFNVRSFRSNVVLRWEWRLGSTLYLVWQQNRSSTSIQGRLVNAPALWESLTSTGDNLLALKISYWLPVD